MKYFMLLLVLFVVACANKEPLPNFSSQNYRLDSLITEALKCDIEVYGETDFCMLDFSDSLNSDVILIGCSFFYTTNIFNDSLTNGYVCENLEFSLNNHNVKILNCFFDDTTKAICGLPEGIKPVWKYMSFGDFKNNITKSLYVKNSTYISGTGTIEKFVCAFEPNKVIKQ